MRGSLPSNVWILVACLTAFSACSRSSSSISQGSVSAAAAPSAASSSVAESASLDLAYTKPAIVGASVRATAKGLPPGKTVDLTWGTVNAGGGVRNYYEFHGKKYTGANRKIGEVPGDSQGPLAGQVAIRWD